MYLWVSRKSCARALSGISGAAALALLWASEVPLTNKIVIDANLNGAQTLVVADLDGDGDLDAAAGAGAGDKIVWYESNGQRPPVYTERVVDAAADGVRQIAVADVDGDSNVDLLAAIPLEGGGDPQLGEIVWYESNGASPATFTKRTVDSAASGARAVHATDVDGDGDTDVLGAAANDSAIHWYENDGLTSPGFTKRALDAAAVAPSALFAADMDDDGDIDVLAALDQGGALLWYENNGQTPPAFTERSIDADFPGAYAISAADMDGDDDLDALGASQGSNQLAWYANDGQSTPAFGPKRIVDAAFEGARTILAYDFDMDGDFDVLGAAAGQAGSGDEITWYESDGASPPAFTTRVVDGTLGSPRAAVMGDVDKDGDLDVVGASDLGEVAWYENRTIHGGSAFKQYVVDGVFDGAKNVVASDLDGDGDADLAAVGTEGNSVAWFESNGQSPPVFTRRWIDTNLDSAFSVWTADLDRDGDEDVLAGAAYLSASGNPGEVVWYENDGAAPPTFVKRSVDAAARGARTVRTADLDGDGDQDVLTALGPAGDFVWYESNGQSPPLFTRRVVDDTAGFPFSVVAGDLDGDGDNDVLAASSGANRISWYENDGAVPPGFNVERIIDAAMSQALWVHAADLDRDGDIDAIATGGTLDQIAWYENNGGSPPAFLKRTIDASVDLPVTATPADFDRDGDLDLIASASTADQILLYESNGARPPVFTKRILDAAAEGANHAFPYDIDGDGDIDVVTAAQNGDRIAYLENRGGSLGLPTTALVSGAVPPGTTLAVLQIDAQHLGRAGDSNVNLTTLELMFEATAGDPLTTQEASARANELKVHLDDGSGAFEPAADPVVANPAFALDASGRQTVQFASGDPNATLSVGPPKRYFVSLELAAAAPGGPIRVTHLTEASSTGEDAATGDPISVAFSPNTTASINIDSTDTTPPVRSNGQPTGMLPSGVTQAPVALDTNENATCRYSSTPGVAFASMTGTFDTTGGLSHSELAVGLLDGLSYTFYIRCQDSSGNPNTTDLAVSFSVSANATGFSFSPSNPIDAGLSGANRAHVADMDGDGDADVIAAASVANKIVLYENDGASSPGFTARVIDPLIAGAFEAYPADLDQDGDMDIVGSALTDDIIAWYESDGASSPAFTKRVIDSGADGARAVAVTDLDADGDSDVVAALAATDEIVWYESNGASPPAFIKRVVGGLLDLAIALRVADVNGDGALDVIAAGQQANDIVYFESNGAALPAFTKRTLDASLSAASGVSAGDLDGDGDLDVLATAGGGDQIVWYENGGGVSPTFSARQVIDPTIDFPETVEAVDLDFDGDLDVLAVAYQADQVAWYENIGVDPPTFIKRSLDDGFDGVHGAVAADLDGDGDLDALGAGQFVGVNWFENETIHSRATFIESTVDGAFAGANDVAGADLDGDGDQDFAAAAASGNEIAWYRNDGQNPAGFAKTTIDSALSSAFDVETIDLDADGDIDVLATAAYLCCGGSPGEVVWYENNGAASPSFTKRIIDAAAPGARFVGASDLDGDGHPDAFAALTDGGDLAWYESNGAAPPAFTKRVFDAGATSAQSLSAADVDGDGDLDLLAAAAGANEVAWYENDGSATPSFTTKRVIGGAFAGARWVYGADVDADGDIDAIAASNAEVAWFDNNGAQTPAFIKRSVDASIASPEMVRPVDVDYDGDLDLFAAAAGANQVVWYESNGAKPPSFARTFLDSNAIAAHAAMPFDIDGDGDIDVLSAARGSNTIGMLENRGGQFGLPTSAVASGVVEIGSTITALKIDATHFGRAGDSDAELATLELLFEATPGDPLTTSEANARIDQLKVYLDNGSGSFEPQNDTLVANPPLNLDGAGKLTIPFANGDPNILLDFGHTRTFLVIVELQTFAPNGPLRLTHTTEHSSTAHNALTDGPLVLSFWPDTTSAIDIQGEDTTPPLRSNGQPSGFLPQGTTQTTISVATNENAECRYSVAAGVSFAAMAGVFNVTNGTAHSEPITGLSDGDQRTYNVKCRDGEANANTDDYAISFSVRTPDATPPTVSLTFPADLATVAGSVNVTASAGDDVSVENVKFFVNGALRATDATAPYGFAWNTNSETNAQHTLTAEARDAAGNTASALIAVTVSNGAPVVAISAPAAGATVSGVAHVRGVTFDDVGVVGGPRLLVDGVLIETGSGSPFDFAWSTTRLTPGPHTVRVEASDSAGNTGFATVNVTVAQETLHNGIVLPTNWPPSMGPSQAPIPAPYLANPPPVIPIDVGRQLFVDDFLIDQSTLVRSRHRPQFWPGNPVLMPGGHDNQGFAMVFSDGVWFDPADNTFKMWYLGDNKTGFSYATSNNGVDWIKPNIPDAVIPNTNVVLASNVRADSSTVWLDHEEPDPLKRFKAFFWKKATSGPAIDLMRTYFSPDGIHWGNEQFGVEVMSDRTTMFWNPFRKLWVKSMRRTITIPAAGNRASLVARSRYYSESPNLTNWHRPDPPDPQTMFWQAADTDDVIYPGSGGAYPQLYNMDSVAYESLIVGLFSIYYPDDQENGLTGPNLVEVNVGFSRDGFHWERVRGAGPDGAFIPASNTPDTWNGYNTQSAGGCFLVVGDELWFYFSGRELPKPDNGQSTTGLARMRRDGFASMDAGPAEGVLTTRPVQFNGNRMFVNVDDPNGVLRVELLNQAGAVIAPFSKANSIPISVDKTLHEVTWSGGGNLASLAGTPVKVRFYLTNGSLYSFWVTPDSSGASRGYVAAGGPGFTGPTDTIGVPPAPPVVEAARLYPPGGNYEDMLEVAMATPTSGAAIYYTLDGSTPTADDHLYTGPVLITASLTLRTKAILNGIPSQVTSGFYVIGNPDLTPPTIAISAPAAGSELAGPQTLIADASDDTGVVGVQFTVDGVNVGAEAMAAPFALALDTFALSDGAHQISAVARDAANHSTAALPVALIVDNTPPVSAVTSPAANAFLRGTVALQANASDSYNLVSVQFLIDGADFGAALTAAPFSVSWDTTQSSAGPHTIQARAIDGAGNVTVSAAVAVVVDNVAPTITIDSPAAAAMLAGSATVSSTPNDNGPIAGVRYFLDGVELGTEITVAPYSTAWDTTQAGNGPRALTATVRDAAGNTGAATAVAVTVDNVPPTVAITSPADDATVKGTVVAAATAADNLTVAHVKFFVDGVERATVGAAPYQFNWDTTADTSGAHTLRTEATDGAGSKTAVEITVSVDNVPPTVAVAAPADQATVRGTILTMTTAADNLAVSHVKFFVDGVERATDTTAPYEYNWDTTAETPGPHALRAEAADGAGTLATSAITVTVDNQPPTVTVTAPADQATVSGAALASAIAADNLTVARVTFYVDGVERAAVVTAPYQFSWDTTADASGPHTLRAEAADGAGATASSTVAVTVDNDPPTVAITAPMHQGTVSGALLATATAADNVSLISVKFFVDGALRATVTTAPYTFNWNTVLETGGPHTLRAEATDGAGATASSEVAVAVDNQPPTVAITAPPDQATITGALLATATAADNLGVADVKFFVDGVLRATATSAPYQFNWNTSGDSDGAHTLRAEATDGAGATASVETTVQVDNNPPSVSILSPTNLATVNGTVATSATATDAVGVSSVKFFVDGTLKATDDDAPYQYNWDTSGETNGAHTLRAEATDGAGATSFAEITVTVDSEAPVVAITSPADQAAVNGVVPVAATATDSSGIANVKFFVDGALRTTDTGAPYGFNWNTAPETAGVHTLRAEATDGGGSMSSSEITVTVDRAPPTVSILSPADGATVNGSVSVTATAADDVGVIEVKFFVDGVERASDATAPYQFNWNTSPETNGPHTLRAEANDGAGGTASAQIGVTVDSQAPTVALTFPANGAAVRGVVAAAATASDAVGVSNVKFFVDGVLRATDATAPYQYNWDTTAETDGPHAVRADATDAGGAVASSSVAVTVDNTAPAVAITAPADGAGVLGPIVAVTANAADPGGIAGVQFLVDGALQADDTAAPFSFDWNALAQGPHIVTATARDVAGNTAVHQIGVTVTPPAPPPGTTTLRLRGGAGTPYTDSQGRVWERDQHFEGGGQASAPTVTGTPDPQLYRIARSSLYSNFGWAIPVGNGQYAVTFKFAETTYPNVGQRIFDVIVNGTTLLDDFDIVAETGVYRKALDKSFTVNVFNGLIDIDIVAGNRYGIVSAIEIVPSGAPAQDTTPPALSNGGPSGALPAGTAQATLSLSTNENATCRYATVAGTAYASMPNTFSTTGGQQHQTAVSGLSGGQSYTYYVRCLDAANNANTIDYLISFSVDAAALPTIAIASPAPDATVSGQAQITTAVTGQNLHGVTFFVGGVQQGAEDTAAPYSLNWDTTANANGPAALTARLRYGAPQQTIVSAAVNVIVDNSGPPSGSTTIRLNAGTGNAYTDTQGRVWQGDQYFTGGGQVSSPGVSGTPDVPLYRIARSSLYSAFGWDIPVSNGQYTVRLKFAETTYSGVGQRVFDVAINSVIVLDNFDVVAAAGAWRTAHDESFNIAVTTGVVDIDFIFGNRYGIVSAIEIVPAGPPPVDTTPPARSNGLPSGALAAGTTQTTLSLATDENATCRHSAAPGTAYESMTGLFATTGGQSHQTPVTGLNDGQAYTYYVRCADTLGNANPADFSISFSVASPTPASISITAPSGGAAVSGQTTLTASAQGTNLLGVSFLVGGVQIGAEDTAAPFSVVWNTAAISNGPAALTARLRYGSPVQILDSAPVNVTVDNSGPPPGTTVIRLNAGRLSGNYTDSLGQVWAPDQYFSSGGQISAPGVTGTPEVNLYRVARTNLFDNFSYSIPVSNGAYTLTLKFAETTYANIGDRIFDVVVNGTTLLNDFDIVAETGVWRHALDKTFPIDVTTGVVNINFVKVNRYGIISAIEIKPAGP